MRDRADQLGDVLVEDVAPVLAQMGGDAVGAGLAAATSAARTGSG